MSVTYFTIPKSGLSIRIWDGGMHQFRQYCLDFFDKVKQTAMNMPKGYKIHPVLPSGRSCGPKLTSWEENMGVKPADLRAGMEKFTVMEGSLLMLTRPNGDPFRFEIPVRPIPGRVKFARPCNQS